MGEPCAYCIVKKARGHLRSYAKEDILEQVRSAVKERIPEIWLTAQDTGCYGKDIDSSLPELLKEIIALKGDFKIRLGMINPNHLIKFLDELIEIYKSEKIFKFLHVPVQSGNNEILKAMKRKYTVEEFKEIIDRFKQAIPEITIATDIICGFPGETEKQFYDSLDLIKEIKPSVLNRSRFWPRPGTEAAEMEDQVHGRDTKKRSQLLTDIFKNISRMQNERWLNWQGEVLIDEVGKQATSLPEKSFPLHGVNAPLPKANQWIGRNFAYKPVILHGNYRLGDKVQVRINRITTHDLRAE